MTSGRPSRHESDHPVLITEAEPSLDAQLDARRRKYVIMMGLRVLCLVLAAVFYRVSWWLLAVFVAGAVVLPWMAVLIANDRPPIKAKKVARYDGRPDAGRALQAPADTSHVIDG